MQTRFAVVSVVVACTDSMAPVEQPPPPANVATGELGAWQPGPALPTARANHCTAAIADWVVVIGGNHKQGDGFVKTDEIHAAQIAADGTLGPWQLAGRTPSPVTECSATSAGRTLYIADGIYDRDTDARQVFAADLDDAGMLGALAPIATLPQIAISSEAAVRGGSLLVMDTVLPADGDQTVTLVAPIAGGAWVSSDWGIGFLAQAQYAFGANHAYTIGGYSGAEGNPVQAGVFVAPIAAGGTVGAAVPTTSLPVATAFGEAIAVDDFVFVIGGRGSIFGADASTAGFAAAISADGSLGAWTELAPLPLGRTNHELAVAGDYLVSTGGAGGMGGDANVLVARVRFPVAGP